MRGKDDRNDRNDDHHHPEPDARHTNSLKEGLSEERGAATAFAAFGPDPTRQLRRSTQEFQRALSRGPQRFPRGEAANPPAGRSSRLDSPFRTSSETNQAPRSQPRPRRALPMSQDVTPRQQNPRFSAFSPRLLRNTQTSETASHDCIGVEEPRGSALTGLFEQLVKKLWRPNGGDL
jgi:hypothetical protein